MVLSKLDYINFMQSKKTVHNTLQVLPNLVIYGFLRTEIGN